VDTGTDRGHRPLPEYFRHRDLAPPYAGQIPAPDVALRGLGKAAFHACSALATHFGKPSPALTQDEDITRANGAALLNELVGDVLVRLRDS
jgi:hypothetical protein